MNALFNWSRCDVEKLVQAVAFIILTLLFLLHPPVPASTHGQTNNQATAAQGGQSQ